ncbi:Transposase DDE domain protein [uncultured archaeon]|nr:Transposase DDE domain protein [uncultured archaeon]
MYNTDFDERFKCLRCGSEHFIKTGKVFSAMKGVWWQKYRCQVCNRKFKGRTPHMVELPKFVYEPKEEKGINWASYNAAQLNEKITLLNLLSELLDMVEIIETQATGRPAIHPRDILFCMTLKAYEKLSSRRLASDLKILKDMGYISRVPSYSTLMIFFNDKRLTRVLKELIELAAIPLSQIEDEAFAIDSTGFSTSKFGRWFDHKFGEEAERRIYRKAHIMIGTKTGIITALKVTGQNVGDSPQLEYLVKKTKLAFEMKTICADKAYLSINNLKTIADTGAQPRIPFKSNSREWGTGNGFLWKKLYDYFKNEPQAFYREYHARSCVESAISSFKQKFDHNLLTKNETANFNEILCKLLAYNLTRLIWAYYEFDLKVAFSTETPNMAKIEVTA